MSVHNERDKDTSVVRGITTQDGRTIPSEAISEVLATPGVSQTKASEILGCSRKAISNWIDRNAGVKTGELSLTITGERNPLGTKSLSPEEMCEERGLDPDQYELHPTINAWDALTGDKGVVTLCQMSVKCVPKVNVEELYARPDGYVYRPPSGGVVSGSRIEAIFNDHHAPFHELGLHHGASAWLQEFKPYKWHCIGDGMDYPEPSRHRQSPGNYHRATPNECQDSFYYILRDYIESSPDSKRSFCPGNHDFRVLYAIIEKIPSLYDWRMAGEDGKSMLSLETVLRLDELGIEYVEPEGDYHQTEIRIDKGLVAFHGTLSGPTGGAHKAGKKRETSLVQAHDHKQAMTTELKIDDYGVANIYKRFSSGAMCRRNLGYTPDPDVHQGFLAFTIWPDGRWQGDHATWDEREQNLTFRDFRYDHKG